MAATGTIAVSALATGLLSVVLVVLVANIDLLTNAPPATNALLVGVVPVVFAGGLLGAAWLRRYRPQVYARIGAVHPEDGSLPAAEPTDAEQAGR